MAHRRTPYPDKDAICAEILSRLEQGESLRAICAPDGMPSAATVCSWVMADDGLAERYARARDLGLDRVAEQVLEIADELPATLDNGATDSGGVAHQRLRFDARRWYLSKLAPKRYGDKTTTEHTGPDGGPIRIADDAQAAARLASILADASKRKADDDYSDLV